MEDMNHLKRIQYIHIQNKTLCGGHILFLHWLKLAKGSFLMWTSDEAKYSANVCMYVVIQWARVYLCIHVRMRAWWHVWASRLQACWYAMTATTFQLAVADSHIPWYSTYMTVVLAETYNMPIQCHFSRYLWINAQGSSAHWKRHLLFRIAIKQR